MKPKKLDLQELAIAAAAKPKINLLANTKESEKTKEEKKRLKVFVSLGNMSAPKKKNDDSVKPTLKEHSAEPRSENSTKGKCEEK